MRVSTGPRVALAVVLVAGIGLAGAGTAAADSGIEWAPCPENAAVECGEVTVPIDWARPGKGTIDIAVARRKATDPDARIGTLLFLPGGPGGSGVNTVLAGGRLPADIAARFDIVGFDPRGTNRSHPVVCDAALVANPPEQVPDLGARLSEMTAYSKRLGRSCREHTGPLIDHVDTASVARDMDALRAALGERQVSLYGISYGTLTGQMYAERFPQRVRAMVLDSVFDHSLSTTRFLASEARAAEDGFGQFVAWCEQDASCALHGRDAAEVYAGLYEKALAGELHVPGDPTRPVGPLDLIGVAVNHLYGPHWAELAVLLDELDSQRPQVGAQVAPELTPMPLASFCGDHDFDFRSQREWTKAWRMMNREAPTVRGHFAWTLVTLCAEWPARTGNPQHRTDIDGGPTVLLMNAQYDPATPHEWATSVARQIGDSVLLTYDGWGHGVHNRSECTLGALNRYLIDGIAPAPDTHCAAVPPAQLTTAGSPPTTIGW
ncbi:alpha/beta hydrolase [Actinokineospora fastidiosa]|uniref:Peptidase n=1 Tax=Actinokineospora fastidiosa TaxID=1816 RepID=A0A918LIF8_9PSEU|nr:alpha/beta hydrolase [Actinokineospora fastidiosa]GGS52243.1 peptidase [Actinokineospora fastidiosa]